MKTLVAALAMLGAIAQSAPVPVPAETASVRGRVADKESREPVERAVVTVARLDGPMIHTLTDSDGRYTFAGLPPGRYMLRADPPTFRPKYVGKEYAGPSAPGGMLTLKSAEERTGIDIALPRALVVSGRVLDADGEPAARVSVIARPIEPTGSGGSNRPTDDLGRFRLFGLAPGRYAICAEFAYPVSVQTRTNLEQPVTTCYASALSMADATPVVLGAADRDGVEIRLIRTRTFTVHGTVMDSTGRPADGATVLFERRTVGGSSSTPIAAGRDGRFEIRNIAPGEYAIDARIGGPDRPADRRPLEVSSAAVIIGTADVELVLTTARTAAIQGRIVFEGSPTPPPRDPGYGPMIVRAKFADGIRRSSARTSASVSDGMTFELPEMFGQRRLEIVNMPAGWVLKSTSYKGKDVTDAPVDFQPGAESSTIEVVLHQRGAVLTGRVLDAAGKPVRARVLMISTDPARWPALDRAATAQSSATTGAFGFRAERAGEYAVVALDQTEIIPSEQGRAFFERIVKSGQTIVLAESERRAADLRISKLVEDR